MAEPNTTETVGMRSLESSLISNLGLGAPYILISALGIFAPLLVILAIRLRKRTSAVLLLFPILLIANFLAMFLGAVFRVLRVRLRPAVLITVAVLLAYGLLVGGRAPVMRSVVAVAAVAGGLLVRRPLVRARSRDVLLPILLYPITIPVMIAGVRGTGALLEATPDLVMARFWIVLLLFFDVVFLTLSLWTFEPLMTE